ncbi:hypothetical protein AQUCO_01000732v1 [Aquilegia coerulea]|uniref:Uncharacterized protein n=1 Tax=Aquilegia coerulea TaxID=218851 RepID=A0A2G5EBH9_AQUCA|nr:hypothetical protein AQUCO_01000732v1 [Aquilegia coerulea]
MKMKISTSVFHTCLSRVTTSVKVFDVGWRYMKYLSFLVWEMLANYYGTSYHHAFDDLDIALSGEPVTCLSLGWESSKPFLRLWWDEIISFIDRRANPHNQWIEWIHPGCEHKPK